MRIHDNYPCKKVMIGFLLSPCISGCLLSLFSIGRILFDVIQNSSIIGEVKTNEIFTIIILPPILWVVVFIPSSLTTAILLCFFRLKRTLRNIISISFFGGLSSTLWIILLLLFIENINDSIKDILLLEFTPLLFLCFLLQWISYLITSISILPSNKNINQSSI